jgi:uncharacterized repeat protein (TIGR02059 family)
MRVFRTRGRSWAQKRLSVRRARALRDGTRRGLSAFIAMVMLVSGLVLVVQQPAYAAPPAAPAANTIAVSADGTRVSMTFTQDLHPNIAPAEQFKVTIGTYSAPTTRTVDVPVIDVTRTTARIITLTLDGVIDHNKPPLVAYTAPPNVAGTDNFALQNLAGEDVANFSVVSTGTQSLVPGLLSSTPPTLQAAGNTIQLTYSLALAAAPALPDPNAFFVLTNGSTLNPVVTVTRPTTTTVLLTMRDGVESGTPVTVSYVPPEVDNASATNAAIQGTAGNDAQGFQFITVTNTASLVPKLTSAAVLAAGNVIELTFNQTLAATTAPASAFRVTHDGSTMNVKTAATSGTKTVLTLDYNVSADQTVLVSYTAPEYNISATNAAIQRATSGQDALSFTDYVVGTNNSGAPYIVSTSTSTSGQHIYLDYNEPLFNNSSQQAKFVVTVNGVVRTLSNARYLSSQRYELTLSGTPYIGIGATVSVSYTPATWDATTSTATVQDSGGADAPPFTDLAITNTSTLDNTPPTIVDAVVSADGLSVRVNYSEGLRTSSTPTSRFKIFVDGVQRTVTGISGPTAPNDFLTLTVGAAILGISTVTLDYTYTNDTGAVRDPANNPAATVTGFAVTNGSTLVDTTPPALVSAVVASNGLSIQVNYDEDLKAATIPASRFRIVVNGTERTITAVSGPSAASRFLTLTVSPAIDRNALVRLDYTFIDDDAAVRDPSGNPAASVTDFVVTNSSTASDTTPPILVDAVVAEDGMSVRLNYNERLTTSSTPTSLFKIFVDGLERSVTAISGPTNPNTFLTLTVGTYIPTGASVTLNFTNTSTTSGVRDLSNNFAASLTGFPVTNQSTVLDRTPPVLLDAVVAADGLSVQVNYNEDLQAATIPTDRFRVFVGGVERTVTAVSGPTESDRFLTLTVDPFIPAGLPVTLNYLFIDDFGAVRDLLENPAASVTGLVVTNGSTVADTIPPTIVDAVVAANGLSVRVNYSESLKTSSTPASRFRILVDGVQRAITAISGPTAPNDFLTLSVGTVIPDGAVVTLDYTYTDDVSAVRDPSNNPAATVTGLVVENGSTIDLTPPVLLGIEVPASGDRLILLYDEALGPVLPPLNTTTFGITANGVAWLPTSISVSGSSIVLIGPRTIDYWMEVVLAYYTAPAYDASPANAAIQDVAGNDAASLSNVSVVNRSDLDLPRWLSASTDSTGTVITLVFDRPLSEEASALPSASAFEISNPGFPERPVGVTGVSVSGDTVTLTLDAPVGGGRDVTLTYTAPAPVDGTGNAAIQDVAGQDASTLMQVPVTNNSTVEDPPFRGTITGRVFQDFDSNGSFDAVSTPGRATDVGVGSVTVRAFDRMGILAGVTTSAPDGTYVLTVYTDSDDVRVEFSLPSSGPLAALRPSVVGSGPNASNGTTVQFVSFATADGDIGAAGLSAFTEVEDSVSGIDLAVNVPGEYCQANPYIAISRLCAGTGGLVETSPSVFVTRYDGGPYDTTTGLNNAFTNWNANRAADKSQTGSILGMAYDPSSRRVFNSAYLRRHAEMYENPIGTPLPGAIFVTTPNGIRAGDPTGGSTSFFVDLEALLPEAVFSAGDVESNATRRIDCLEFRTSTSGDCTTTTGWDVAAAHQVGEVGIGDIETDGQHLWVMSLYDQNLYEVDLPADGGVPTTMRSLGSPATGMTCTNGKARTFSVTEWRGSLYMGVVCDGADDFDAADPWKAKDANITFTVRSYDLSTGTFSTFFGPHPLNSSGNVVRGGNTSNATTTTNFVTSRVWNPWTSFYPSVGVGGATVATSQLRWHNRGVPMLSEIQFDRDGSMILGFRDRTGDQTSTEGSWTLSGRSTAYPAIARGDIYRVCRVGEGYEASDYVFEGGPGCDQRVNVAYPSNMDGSVNGTEYYWGDAFAAFGSTTHGEVSSGMLLQVPGFPDLLMSAFDPYSGARGNANVAYTGGVRYLSNATGGPMGEPDNANSFPNAGNGVMVYTSAAPLNVGSAWDQPGPNIGGFMKVNGMSDIEALCDLAPVQIGNRIWIDLDRNGIQDPGEEALSGVTVRLYDSSGVLVGTAITDENGNYLFASDVTEPAEGTGDHVGGGLTVGETFTIRLDEPTDYEPGGPLFGYSLTEQTSTSTEGSLSTAVDSDATMVGGVPTIEVAALAAGENNHTFDAGFSLSGVSVGDFVWLDVDRDGIHDDDEVGLPGVTVSLLYASGVDEDGNVVWLPVLDAGGEPVTAVTDEDGFYLFDGLPPGQYQVVVTAPEGYVVSTVTTRTSAELTEDGDQDLSLDFGLYTTLVSVGDFVWLDTDRDGIHDVGEEGLPGITVRLLYASGVDEGGNVVWSPVLDADGEPVTAVTDDAGEYLFEGLPPGQYQAVVTVPEGFTASTLTTQTSAELSDGASDLTLDFGLHQIPVSVGDFVWLDLDRDGVQDVGEPGVAGVVVRLFTPDGSPVLGADGQPVTATTSETGFYLIDGLLPGTYYATFTLPEGYAFTTALAGTDGTADSDAVVTTDPLVGKTADFTLSASLTGDMVADTDEGTVALFVNPTIDAGIVPVLVSVGDFVWLDANRDGLQDARRAGPRRGHGHPARRAG